MSHWRVCKLPQVWAIFHLWENFANISSHSFCRSNWKGLSSLPPPLLLLRGNTKSWNWTEVLESWYFAKPKEISPSWTSKPCSSILTACAGEGWKHFPYPLSPPPSQVVSRCTVLWRRISFWNRGMLKYFLVCVVSILECRQVAGFYRSSTASSSVWGPVINCLGFGCSPDWTCQPCCDSGSFVLLRGFCAYGKRGLWVLTSCVF